MTQHILPIIHHTPHTRYVEPFCGGGAVFWEKNPSESEAINDLDGRVINFYRVLQTRFDELKNMIDGTLHSESDYHAAKMVLKDFAKHPLPVGEVSVVAAWAFWMQTNLSFGKGLFKGFAFDGKTDKGNAGATFNRKQQLTDVYAHRLKNVEVFSRDAVSVITAKDSPSALIYCDPPYVSSDCGHYKGYTQQDFVNLLDTLSGVDGKFILSSYPEAVLHEYVLQYGWHQQTFEQALSMSENNAKTKLEVLTMNFTPATRQQLSIFSTIPQQLYTNV